MPTAIVAGSPADIERRIRAALKTGNPFPSGWNVVWLRAKARNPGLAPSQIEEAVEAATAGHGAHLLVFRGGQLQDDLRVKGELGVYFRFRWLEPTLLRLIPHSMPLFFGALTNILQEEAEWSNTVQPRDEACCLLLPECAFMAASHVKHVWTAATESGIERIRLAARARQHFSSMHWFGSKTGGRGWVDDDGKFFDHKGPRHGVAPALRPWKYSYRVADGFHYDVTSRNSRRFRVKAWDGRVFEAAGDGHVNIDPHGYVRS